MVTGVCDRMAPTHLSWGGLLRAMRMALFRVFCPCLVSSPGDANKKREGKKRKAQDEEPMDAEEVETPQIPHPETQTPNPEPKTTDYKPRPPTPNSRPQNLYPQP